MCILSLEELFSRNFEESTQSFWERMLAVTVHPMLQKSCVHMYMSPRSYLILVILDFNLTQNNMRTSLVYKV